MTHSLPHMAFDEWLVGLSQYLLGIVFVFFFGRIAHELTHVLVANAFGLEVEEINVGLFNGHVEYRVTSRTPWWQPRAVNAAPQLIGIVVGLPALAFVILTEGPLSIFLGLVLWVAYAGLGSASDLSLTAAEGDGHLWHPTKAEQLAVIALALLVAGFILGAIDPNTPYFGPFRRAIHLGLAFAAMGVLGMSLLEYNSQQPA